jgi:acetate kinase
VIDDALIGALAELLPAAPAHNAIYLAAIRAFREALPPCPWVAAMETEFHTTMPDAARHYGVPKAWRAEGVASTAFMARPIFAAIGPGERHAARALAAFA